MGLFAVWVALVGLLLSVLAHPWVPLSLWRVFRRCVSIAAALVLFVMVRRQTPGHPWRSLGLTAWRDGRRQLLQGVGLGLGMVLALGVGYLGFGVWDVALHPDRWKLWRTVLGFLPAAGLIAILEELVFRGYLFQQLLACSRLVAIVGTSAAYALVHVKPNLVWPSSGWELGGLFLLGVVLAASVLRTGRLYLAIGLHGVLAYCARVNKLVVARSDSSLQWLVGSDRLVNGLIAWLALILLGLAMARWKRREIA
ncbi:MAG: CPBP family intramembrane metalloprotease [Candidatus Omnitrophica bacterium]|nr:CPBP family intramembrane metalloprotease [Candidatus Omnitrophota bacterium]